MPRCVRIFVPGGIYHVYCRIARGEFIANEPGEVDHWVDLVAFVSRLYGLRILAWCLLSNHYHLVVQSGSTPLHHAMARLQGRFAREFNRERRLRGRLWQSRYKARLVLDGDYLRHVIAYVHLNPVAAGIVADPLEYPASGHGELMAVRQPVLCDVDSAMLCFDEETREARWLYQARIRMVAEARWLRAGVRELPWWKTVDNNDETAPIAEAPAAAQDFTGQPLAPERHRRPPISEILAVFECELEVPEGHLAGSGRSRLLAWHRCLFATFAASWMGHPVKDVAATLNKAPGSVSRWLGEGLELQLSEPSFRARLEQLSKVLMVAETEPRHEPDTEARPTGL